MIASSRLENEHEEKMLGIPAPIMKTLLENGQAKQATSREVTAAGCIVMLVQQLRRLRPNAGLCLIK